MTSLPLSAPTPSSSREPFGERHWILKGALERAAHVLCALAAIPAYPIAEAIKHFQRDEVVILGLFIGARLGLTHSFTMLREAATAPTASLHGLRTTRFGRPPS